jgi:hypothetical protein
VEGPVREVWALEETDGMVGLTVELYDIDPDSKLITEFSGGLVYILSGLKTLVETEQPMARTG